MKTSTIIQLQQDAVSGNIPVTELLRKALSVAIKLKVKEFEKWIRSEMDGYSKDSIPDYRIVTGTLQAHNPYRGLIPVIVPNKEIESRLSSREIKQPIAEIEHLYNQGPKEVLQIPFPTEILQAYFPDAAMGIIPFLRVSNATLKHIVDSVRNKVLEWALKLEQDGILGQDFIFSEDEVKKASNSIVNYGTLIYGDITKSAVVQGGSENTANTTNQNLDWSALERLIKQVQSYRENLIQEAGGNSEAMKNEITALEQAILKKDKGLVKQSVKSIRNILEGISGSLIASGILQEFSKIFPVF